MTLAKVLLGATLCSVSLASLACENPSLVQVPKAADVKEKDRADLLEDVQAYLREVKVYTDCVQAELAAAGGDTAPALTKAVLVTRNNAAVAEADAIMKLYTANFGANNAGPPPPAPPPPPK
jgi:hypothetical protein